MKKILKWAGLLVLTLVVIVLVMGLVIYYSTSADINARYDIDPVDLVIPEPDSALMAQGLHVAQTRCMGCHGANLGGEVMVDDPAFGHISSSNLTSGQGGIGGVYTDKDWIRAIRDGVGRDGRPLLIMPANELIHLGREDLQAVIAYVKSVPPVDHTPEEQRVGPMARALHFFSDDFPLLNVEKVDHTLPLPEVPERSPTPDFGKYLSRVCEGCHGANLAGASNGPPDAPPSANLTKLQSWSKEDFERAIRTGVRPAGDTLHGFMPRMPALNDVEVGALWAYIQTLEPQKGPADR